MWSPKSNIKLIRRTGTPVPSISYWSPPYSVLGLCDSSTDCTGILVMKGHHQALLIQIVLLERGAFQGWSRGTYGNTLELASSNSFLCKGSLWQTCNMTSWIVFQGLSCSTSHPSYVLTSQESYCDFSLCRQNPNNKVRCTSFKIISHAIYFAGFLHLLFH